MSNKQELFCLQVGSYNTLRLYKIARGRDYLLTFPSVTQGIYTISTHFTFHTPNNRLTWKTTKVENNKSRFDVLQSTLKKLENHALYRQMITSDESGNIKDFDMFGKNGGKTLSFKDKGCYKITSLCLNFEGVNVEEFFRKHFMMQNKCKSNTVTKNVNLKDYNADQITIDVFMSIVWMDHKNGVELEYDGYFYVTDENNDKHNYEFIFAYKFSFPVLDSSGDGITFHGSGEISLPK